MKLIKRQWGFYLTLLDRKQFKVKLLRFHTLGKLSYQWHKHRNELWLFLRGQGNLYVNGKTIKNQDKEYSGFYYMINSGSKHTFEAWKPTWILEIQFGSKCVEEDITRL